MSAVIEATSSTTATPPSPIVVPRFSRETTVVGESGWGWEAYPEDVTHLTIAWSPTLGRVTTTGFPVGAVSEPRVFETLQESLATHAEVRSIHERLAKLETNHPALLSEDLRLVRTPVGANLSGSLYGRLRHRPEMKQDWMSPAYALAAHDADPLKFGTPLIVYRASDRDGDGVGWAVRLSGVDSDVAFARWDDRESVRELVDMALSHNAELGATLASLSGDTETVREQAMEAERKRLAANARETWKRPRDRVKPRVCKDLLAAVWLQHVEATVAALPYEKAGWARAAAVRVDSISVSEQDVWGRQSGASRTPLNVAASLKMRVDYALSRYVIRGKTPEELDAMNRERETQVRECYPPSSWDRLAVSLAAETRARGLGEVVRVVSTTATSEGVLAEFLAVKLPHELPQHALAFDLPEDARFEVARLGGDSVLSWEPLEAKKK